MSNGWEWSIITILQACIIYSFIQHDRLWKTCRNAYHWAQDVISAKYDLEDFTDTLLDIHIANKITLAKGILASLFNMIFLFQVMRGDISMVIEVLCAAGNGMILLQIYNARCQAKYVRRFISSVELEAMARDKKNKQTKEVNDE